MCSFARSLVGITLMLLVGAADAFAAPRVVAYVPNWIDLKAFAPTIEYAKLTHINIAFENPTNDEGDLSFSKKNGVLIDAAHAAKVQVLISIGGGAASGDKVLLARYNKYTDGIGGAMLPS